MPQEPWGYFHAQFKDVVKTADAPAPRALYTIADIAGRGKYVGTFAYLSGHNGGDLLQLPLNFLEGDEFGYLDGEAVPSMQGTGTEDYFDGAWYFIEPTTPITVPPLFSWPLNINVDVTNNRGDVTAFRSHLLSTAIEFSTAFRLTLEYGPDDVSSIEEYASTAFYYLDRP